MFCLWTPEDNLEQAKDEFSQEQVSVCFVVVTETVLYEAQISLVLSTQL